MSRILRHTNESGRSMVEMLGVLAIVGVLSIGGIAGYSKAMAKYKMNKALDQISMIVTNTRTIFGNQYSYYGLTASTAKDYEIVGQEAINTGTDATTVPLKNPFGGKIDIYAANNGAACTGEGVTDCPSFILSYEGLDRNECATIASGDWGSSSSSGLVEIKINGTGGHTWDNASPTVANELPILYTQAYTECSVTAATGNTITFEYN